MLGWLGSLRAPEGAAVPPPGYPFVLSAGERRSSNATTVFRDPRWRKAEGTLRIHPDDAGALGVGDGDKVVCQSENGEVEAKAQLDGDLRRGHRSLPHGFGLAFGVDGQPRRVYGPAINHLTSSDHCDPVARTPYHKTIPVRLRRSLG